MNSSIMIQSASDSMKQYTDPNDLMKLPYFSRQIRWRIPLEVGEFIARLTFRPFGKCFDTTLVKSYYPERGLELADTAVTANQRAVLVDAVNFSEGLPQPIVEIGAWRGATTSVLAAATRRTIYAVDPYNNYAEADSDMAIMLNRIKGFPQVKHIRERSGRAANQLFGQHFSLIFIDAIHDYINTWFDFLVWERLLVPGGILAFHDVDDHVGTNLACRRILKRPEYKVWGYSPNMAAFIKVKGDEIVRDNVAYNRTL